MLGRKKHFDTSGKSPALLHHHAISKTPMALPTNRPFGAIAGKNPSNNSSCFGSPRESVAAGESIA
jgi:hypothetical protein